MEYEIEEKYSGEKLVFEKKASIISIPFDISIEDIQKQINAGLPDLIFEDKSFEDNNNDDLKAKVWRKGNLIFTDVSGDILTYEVPLKIWAQKRISILGVSQAPSTEFELKLKFSSKFTVTKDYKIETITNPQGFSWITKPILKTTYIEIPIGVVIGKLIENNQQAIAKQIDQAIEDNLTLKPQMINAWNTARKPFLASAEYNTWVKLDPIDVFLTPLKSNGKSLKSIIGFKVFVETLVGTPTEIIQPVTNIPDLKIVSVIPDAFEVSIFNIISYEEAIKISKNMFVGQIYEFKEGKYKIEITDLDIFGNNEFLVFKTTTKGSFKGTIFIKGIPVYDPVKQQVVLTKTELDIKTKNFLHKAGSWLLEGTMEKKIEKEFGLPLSEIIGYVKESVTQTINSEFSKGIKMKGVILEITPKEVIISPNGILSIITAKAKVDLIIKGL